MSVVNIPSNGTLDKKYVSLLATDLDLKAFDMQLGDAFRNNDFNSIVGLDSRKQVITQNFWRNRVTAQTDYLFDTTGATPSGNGTNTITTTCAGTDAAKYVRPMASFFSTSGNAIVQSVSIVSGRTQVVLKVTSGTATFLAGEKFIVGGIVGGEKSGTPTPLRSGILEYSNQYGIHVDSDEVTDVEKVNKVTFNYKGQDSFAPLSLDECLSRLKNSVNKDFIYGDMSGTKFSDSSPFLTDVNTANGGGGGAVQTTRGLWSWTTSYGVVQKAVGSGSTSSPAPNGVVTKYDINQAVFSLIAQRADAKQLVVGSSASLMGVDEYAKNLNSSGAVSVRLNISGKELDTEVTKIIVGGFEFNFARLPIFDNNTHQYHQASKCLHFMPFNGMVPVAGGGMKPALGLKYVKNVVRNGLGDEMITESQEGAYAPNTPSGTINYWKTKFETKQGLDVAVPTQLFALQVVA